MEQAQNTKILANGALYDMDRKRIVSMRPDLATKNTQITPANAGVLQAQRMINKRAALAAGAQRVLEQSGRVPSGDLDFVSAIGEALMASATDPSNRQQVRAAELLIRETGLSEAREQAQPVSPGQAADIIGALAQFAAAITGGDVGSVDGIVIDNYSYRNHEQPPVLDAGTEAPGSLSPCTETGAGTGNG